jgi:hypothetical protein
MNYSAAERSIKDATAHANFAVERRGTYPGIPTSRKSWLSGCDSVTGCFAPLTLSSFEINTKPVEFRYFPLYLQRSSIQNFKL